MKLFIMELYGDAVLRQDVSCKCVSNAPRSSITCITLSFRQLITGDACEWSKHKKYDGYDQLKR